MQTTAPLIVKVNDRPCPVEGASMLADLMRGLGMEGKKGVAAAVNGAVVPRTEWAARRLAADDRVLLIQATQGG